MHLTFGRIQKISKNLFALKSSKITFGQVYHAVLLAF